jgi:pullulanase
MRSKPLPAGGFDHNSYESPDIVNQLRWDRKATYNDVFEYYKGLIEVRKSYNQFRINNATEIRNRLTFLATDQGNRAVAYEIKGLDNEPDIIVIHSGTPSFGLTYVQFPDSTKIYRVISDTLGINPKGNEIVSVGVFVPTNTSMILIEVQNPSVTIPEPNVAIPLNASFDPSSNVVVNNTNATVTYSTSHSTSVPGRYVITVSVKESYGLVTHHYYLLTVGTPTFNVTINKSGLGE